MSESEKMAQMEAWLDQVCAALDVDREVFVEVTPEVLDLVVRLRTVLRVRVPR